MNTRRYGKTGCDPQPFYVIQQSATLTAEDTAWFTKHPDRLFRARLACNAEVAAFRGAGYEPPPGSRVAIAMRHLRISDLLMYEFGPIGAAWRDPSELDDVGAEALFDSFIGWKGGTA
jgi:hypothetical protein